MPAEVEVGPDERDAVMLFMAMTTQWRIHPMAGVRLGMIYEAVPAIAAALGLAMTPALLHDLRTMEAAALSAAPANG